MHLLILFFRSTRLSIYSLHIPFIFFYKRKSQLLTFYRHKCHNIDKITLLHFYFICFYFSTSHYFFFLLHLSSVFHLLLDILRSSDDSCLSSIWLNLGFLLFIVGKKQLKFVLIEDIFMN